MAVTVFCPKCETKLRVPDTAAGKKVRCRACGKVFAAEPEEEEEVEEARPSKARRRRDADDQEETVRRRARDDEEEEEEDEEEERRRKIASRPMREQVRPKQWMKVAHGLQFVGTGIVMFLLSILVFGLSGLVLAGGVQGSAAGVINSAMGFAAFMCLGIMLEAIGFGCTVGGLIMCLWAPPFYGAKYLAVTALCLVILSMVVMIVGGTIGLIAGPLVGPAVSTFAQMLLFGQAVVFLFFLRANALILNRGALAGSTIVLLAFGVIILVLAIALYTIYLLMVFGLITLLPDLMTTGVATGLGLVFLIMVFVSLVFYLMWIIWYTALIFRVRGAILQHIGAPS